jgi:hypothetical protein
MPIYQVTPLGQNSAALAGAVRQHIEQADRYLLPNRGGWLISYGGTTIELSHKLTITNPDKTAQSAIGSVLVTLVSSYYGRGRTDMWEWLKTRMERS